MQVRANIPPAKAYLVEGVEVYQGAVSQAAAIRGDLIGLAYMVMSIALVLDGDVQIISPRWKGQLPYDALRKWCVKLVGINAPNDHVAAAIGMGLDHYGSL